MSNEVAVYDGAPPALRPDDIKAQVALIQDVMKSVMKKDEHYGVVPGCGDKPTLLQPGAQKLIMTFRLVPDPEVDVIELYHISISGHREYRVKVKLYTQNGIFLGAGVGSCSTMEGKFRYRKADITCPECGKAAIIKGKAEFGGGWVCYQKKGGCNKKWSDADNPFESVITDKAEHDNPADYYNTCEKMAYKRALVSATLTVTAASDIFTQDVEDMPEIIPRADKKSDLKPPQSKSTKPADKPAEQEGKSVRQVLIEELTAYVNKDVAAFKKALKEITAFGDNKGTDDVSKLSEKWAGSALGKLRKRIEEENPGIPDDCTKDPGTCEHSSYDSDGNAGCIEGKPCKYYSAANA